MLQTGQRYKYSGHGKLIAVLRIQKTVRKWLSRRKHLVSLEKLWATIIFQRRWRIRSRGRQLRDIIRKRYLEEDIKRCTRLYNNLKRDYIQFFTTGNKRFIVQISHPRQNEHWPDFDFGRCLPVRNPDVTLIFIVSSINDQKIASLQRLFGTFFLIVILEKKCFLEWNRLCFC